MFALFIGIDVLLDVRPANVLFKQFPCDVWVCQAAGDVTSSYDALLDLFECSGNFLKRLEIYTKIPLTPITTDVVVKLMVELLSVFALAANQIKRGRFSKHAHIYVSCGLIFHREVREEVVRGQRDRGHTPKIGSLDPGRG